MIEQVLNPRNIMLAYRQVVSNQGSAGVDGMSVKELYAYLTKNRAQQAVLKAQEYINAGYHHIVDIDLKSFFDEVDHCLMLTRQTKGTRWLGA